MANEKLKRYVRGRRCDVLGLGVSNLPLAEQLRELGVKEVHMCSASPPLLFGCKYLNFSRSRSELDLAARRAIMRLEKVEELTMEIITKYLDCNSNDYKAMVEEVRKELGLNSLHYQTLPGLMEAIGLDRNDICTYCWDGRE